MASDESAPHWRRHYWKSGHVKALGSDLQLCLATAATTAPSPLDQIHIQQLGGALSRGNIAWVRSTWAELEPETCGAYVNFLSEDDASHVIAAYDTATWTRLREVKLAWDPDDVFRINHNIPGAQTRQDDLRTKLQGGRWHRHRRFA